MNDRLLEAIKRRDWNFAKRLIQDGARFDSFEYIKYAINNNDFGMLQFLIANHAILKAENEDALTLCVENKNIKMLQYVLSNTDIIDLHENQDPKSITVFVGNEKMHKEMTNMIKDAQNLKKAGGHFSSQSSYSQDFGGGIRKKPEYGGINFNKSRHLELEDFNGAEVKLKIAKEIKELSTERQNEKIERQKNEALFLQRVSQNPQTIDELRDFEYFLRQQYLQKGGRIDATSDYKTSSGDSALHYACKVGNADLVQILMEYGAKSFVNKNGKTPCDLARENGHNDVVNYIIQKPKTSPRDPTGERLIPEKDKLIIAH